MTLPSNDNNCHDDGSNAPSAVMAAARALQSVSDTSLPAAVTRILQLTARGTGARHATLWRVSGDGRSLRLFCRADSQGVIMVAGGDARVPVDALVQRVIDSDALCTWHRQDAEFDTLSRQFRFIARTRLVHALPARIFGSPHGVLFVEHADSPAAPGPEIEMLLRLATTRIEAAYLAEPLAARARDTAAPVANTSLQQAHLSLTNDSLRDLFYFAPTAMLLTDANQGRPIAANRHALNLFGISTERPDDIRTSQFWEDADDRDRFIKDVMTQGFVRGSRARLSKANGDGFWARISATAIDYDGSAALLSSVTDVSDIVAAEDILNRTQQTLSTLLEASPFPLVVTQLETGVVRYCNRKAADMFETPLSGLLGHTAPEFYVDPSDRRFFVEKLRTTGKVDSFVARLKTRSGQPFWAMLSAKTLEMNNETVFMVAFADVTKQKTKEEELESLAFKDGLTGAYNRRYFVEAVQIELARSERNSRPPALALIDLDHFKQLNDTFGHESGDQVLREFVQIVQGMLRKTDILARYGGEEFVVLFPETDKEAAREIVERIRQTVSDHDFTPVAGSGVAHVTFSAGVAGAEADQPYSRLVKAADEALYAAKRSGRDHVRIST